MRADDTIEQLALDRLREIRKGHLDWSFAELAADLDAPLEGRLLELATRAGFGEGLGSTPSYGSSPYGTSPYGSRRRYSDGVVSVPRQVTCQGQASYRGYIYNLGRTYRGQITHVTERDRALIFFTPGFPTVSLPAKHLFARLAH